MDYETEQERLHRLWEEVETEEEPDDEEVELASEEDVVEARSSGSESEQDCDDEEIVIHPHIKPRVPAFVGKMEPLDGKSIVLIRRFGQEKKTLLFVYLASENTAKILKLFWNVGLSILPMKCWKVLLKILIFIYLGFLQITPGKEELNPLIYANKSFLVCYIYQEPSKVLGSIPRIYGTEVEWELNDFG